MIRRKIENTPLTPLIDGNFKSKRNTPLTPLIDGNFKSKRNSLIHFFIEWNFNKIMKYCGIGVLIVICGCAAQSSIPAWYSASQNDNVNKYFFGQGSDSDLNRAKLKARNDLCQTIYQNILSVSEEIVTQSARDSDVHETSEYISKTQTKAFCPLEDLPIETENQELSDGKYFLKLRLSRSKYQAFLHRKEVLLSLDVQQDSVLKEGLFPVLKKLLNAHGLFLVDRNDAPNTAEVSLTFQTEPTQEKMAQKLVVVRGNLHINVYQNDTHKVLVSESIDNITGVGFSETLAKNDLLKTFVNKIDEMIIKISDIPQVSFDNTH